MKPHALALCLLTAVAAAHAEEPAADALAASHDQIQQVVEQFKAAIKAHDGEGIRRLFLPGGSWLQGLDKGSWNKVKARKPEARQFTPGDYARFAEFVSKANGPVEEAFDNVRIETDGTIGSVYFDYTFLDAGKQTNHGNETWQLVRTPDGWKISAMLYSIVLDDRH